jgi:hypothetical protein
MPTKSVPSKARHIVPLRLSVSERTKLEAAAALRPEYLTTYIREMALEAARRDLEGRTVSGELMSDVARDAAMQAARRIVAGVASPPKTSAE